MNYRVKDFEMWKENIMMNFQIGLKQKCVIYIKEEKSVKSCTHWLEVQINKC
ncbi:hypothetical protein Taro_032993 [Colocasia esculenta]|uniref:Uncharacterized protein n=1 Tax=Colocasia esculenta TaxID=4460 RepID=A0A843VSR4_COLES|nr:hypothetical protein [Colocasia esculenta]